MAQIQYSILDYIVQQTGAKPRQLGKKVMLNPCPICGHRDHFFVWPESGSYSSFSGCCRGGSLVDWLMEYEKLPLKEALQRVRGNVVGVDRPSPEKQKMQKLAKLLVEKTESFFSDCIDCYKVFKELEAGLTALDVEYINPVYRWIRQAVRFYDGLTERLIMESFKDRVRLMREHEQSYFFKLSLKAGDSLG